MKQQLDCPNCKSPNTSREITDSHERRCGDCNAVWDVRDVEEDNP